MQPKRELTPRESWIVNQRHYGRIFWAIWCATATASIATLVYIVVDNLKNL